MNIRDAQEVYDSQTPQEWDAVEDVATEFICDKIAEEWVKDGGDVSLWLQSVEEIALMIERGDGGECGICGAVAESWREAGGDANGFIRNAGEIRGWIMAHMGAYGRIKRILG